MFQFPASPSCTLFIHVQVLESLPQVGFPIRKSAIQWLFAPHRSLSQLITSFIGSWCQGIHPMLLLAWPFDRIIDPFWFSCHIAVTWLILKWLSFTRRWVFNPKSHYLYLLTILLVTLIFVFSSINYYLTSNWTFVALHYIVFKVHSVFRLHPWFLNRGFTIILSRHCYVNR